MEDSILISTKKILGLPHTYTVFDADIITHINATFSVLAQLGIGPATGFMILDETSKWSDFTVPQIQLNVVKTYMYLKVRSLFDPPTTSFLLEAQAKQLQEYEWRLQVLQDEASYS